MAAGFVGWKEAEARGLKAVRVLDARVAPHRDGKAFFIDELVEYDSGDRGWRRRMGVGPQGNPYTERYDSQADAEEGIARGAKVRALIEDALAIIAERGLQVPSYEELAALRSRSFVFNVSTPAWLADAWERELKGRRAAEEARRSAEIQREKNRRSEERLRREYEIIVAKGRELAAAEGVTAPVRERMTVEGVAGAEAERVIGLIAARLAEHPYLRHVLDESFSSVRLWVSEDRLTWREWPNLKETWARKRLIAERALATDAFGERPEGNWRDVKARIQGRIKPDALTFLHRKDIQERLAKALEEGKRFVVFRDWGFWWNEETRKWEERQFERGGSGSGNAPGSRVWREGRILSRNHGRIIVLPFTKADGTDVDGHTRNAPGQGRAEPKATPEIIPFEVYDDLGRDDTWDHEGNTHIP